MLDLSLSEEDNQPLAIPEQHIKLFTLVLLPAISSSDGQQVLGQKRSDLHCKLHAAQSHCSAFHLRCKGQHIATTRRRHYNNRITKSRNLTRGLSTTRSNAQRQFRLHKTGLLQFYFGWHPPYFIQDRPFLSCFRAEQKA